MRVRTCEVLLSAAVLLAVTAPRTFAQQCDDFFECTTNDMCSGPFCIGTFKAGPCNDFDPCTQNDRCVDDPVFGPDCHGDPLDPGTPCQDGCGTCEISPDFGLVCMTDGSTIDKPCDPGIGTPCFEGVCSVQFGMLALCAPRFVVCPDTDGDPCTDSCDLQTGQCSPTAAKCLPDCETCNPTSGECEPANQGRACDDADVCTSSSHCGMVDILGVVRGVCAADEETPGPETPTPVVSPTPTQLAGGVCSGDCNNDHMVTVNELILGVNIALSIRTVDACPSFDVSGNDAVEVNELIIAVNHALGSCPT